VFNYTCTVFAVLCGSLLFTGCVCQHCNKGLLLGYYYYKCRRAWSYWRDLLYWQWHLRWWE